MKRYLFPAIGILLLVVAVAQVKAMRQQRGPSPSTVPSTTAPHISAEGRMVAYPGAEVTVGSDVAGTIQSIRVDEKDTVHKGEVIAVIKADDTRAALAEAKARVVEAEADVRLFKLESSRARGLWQQEVGSKQSWDKSDRDLDAARARRASAVAQTRRLEALVAKTVITSPIDGVVISRDVEAGETVSTGDRLMTIADLKRTRVEVEVDEFDTARVSLGQRVTIAAEGFDGQQWSGTIEEIPDAVVSRRLKPQDPSKPVDTRVLLVKVSLSEPTPLKLGQRVEVQIAK